MLEAASLGGVLTPDRQLDMPKFCADLIKTPLSFKSRVVSLNSSNS